MGVTQVKQENNRIRPHARQVGIALAIALALTACGKKDDSADQASAAGSSPVAEAPAVTAESVVSSTVSAMGVDELREAAAQSMREQRLYAPAGNNAMEYYLALRDKQPAEPAVSSALTDLMPYTLIATEQSIARDDFSEAQRLLALMEKTDANAPALPRLKQAIADGQASYAQRVTDAATAAQREQEIARQREVEQQRLQQQQAQQAQQAAQQQQAQQATQQQQQAQQQAAQQQTAQQEAERRAAEQRAAEQRAAEQRAAEQRAAEQRAAAASAAPARSSELRAVSTPAPRFPPDALRSGTVGEVEVEFTVATDGSVSNARVIRANPARVFDRETLNAVRRWRFEPVDAPVTTRRTIGFNPNQ